jgi:dolichol kinase
MIDYAVTDDRWNALELLSLLIALATIIDHTDTRLLLVLFDGVILLLSRIMCVCVREKRRNRRTKEA